jgi:hypothetical protein
MKKTAAAFFALMTMTGAAFAEENETVANSGAVLAKLYQAMDEARAQSLDNVVLKAEFDVDRQLASLEDETEATFTVASN